MAKRLLLLALLSAGLLPGQARSQSCRMLIAQNFQAVSVEWTRLSLQATAQSFPQAMAQLQADLTNLRANLAPANRELLTAYLSSLQNARNASGPGGFASTPVERRQLASAFSNLMLSKTITAQQRNWILRDMTNVTASLQGINGVNLKNAIDNLRSNLANCR